MVSDGSAAAGVAAGSAVGAGFEARPGPRARLAQAGAWRVAGFVARARAAGVAGAVVAVGAAAGLRHRASVGDVRRAAREARRWPAPERRAGSPRWRSGAPSRRAGGGRRRPSRGPRRARGDRATPAAARCRAARAAARGAAGAATGRCSGSVAAGRGATGRARSRRSRRRSPSAAPPGTARWRRGGGTRPRSGRPARRSAPAATTPAGSGSPGPRRRPGRSRRAAPRRRRARPATRATSRGSRSGPTTVARRRVEVARRAVGLDALDVEARSCRPSTRSVASMPPVSSPGNVQLTSWQKNRLNPAHGDPVLRPAAGRVRRPRHGPAEAVLPLGEERIVARGDEHGLGGRLGRRAVVAAELRQAVVEAAQDRRRRGQDREERLLDDLLAGDLLGLLEEDVGDARRVGRGVEPAAALGRELLEERVGAAARADGRERDPVGLHLGRGSRRTGRRWTSRRSAG